MTETIFLTSMEFQIFDPHKSVKAGDDARAIIRDQMMSASKVVVIVSPDTANSHWVNYEVGMASALGKAIVVMGSKENPAPS
jgi:hypothetical protein